MIQIRVFQEQLDTIRSNFQQQLKDVQKRLEFEVEQAKITQGREFDIERRELNDRIESLKRQIREESSKRTDLEGRMAGLMKKLEEEANYGESYQNELKQQLGESERRLQQEERVSENFSEFPLK